MHFEFNINNKNNILEGNVKYQASFNVLNQKVRLIFENSISPITNHTVSRNTFYVVVVVVFCKLNNFCCEMRGSGFASVVNL